MRLLGLVAATAWAAADPVALGAEVHGRAGGHGAEHHEGHHDHDHEPRGKGSQGHDDLDHEVSDHDRHHHDHEQGHKHGGHHGHGAGQQHPPKAAPNWRAAYVSALGMSAVSFVGVALLGFLQVPMVGPIIEYTCLAFAGAVLIADALLHLLPHALEGADHDEMSGLGISAVTGAISLLVVPELCEWHSHKPGHEHGTKIEASGIANLVTEMLHNFVDGIAIGLSFIASPSAGLNASLAVVAHELPQELGDFMVLRAAGFPVPRLLLWNFVASLTCVLGVAAAHFIGQEASVMLQKHLMAFTAGSFLTLSLSMIYPQILASIKAHHSGPALARAKLLCLAITVLAVLILLRLGSMEAGHAEHDHSAHGHGHREGAAGPRGEL